MRALVTARGLSRPVSASAVRQLCAKKLQCSPFEIHVKRGYREKDIGTFELESKADRSVPQANSSSSMAIVALEQTRPAEQQARIMNHVVRAIPHLLVRTERPTWSPYQSGRPLIVSAHAGFGTCWLARFSAEDFRIYRFASPEARQAAFGAFTIAQELLAQTCVELGIETVDRPGCVLSMATGAAVGS